MIDGYKFRNGKVIVVDYNEDNVKTEIEREYQDNIGELLVTETVDIYLSKKKDKVLEDITNGESKIKDYKENNKNLIPLIMVMTSALGGFVNLVLAKVLGVNLFFSCLISYLGSNLMLDAIFIVPNIVKIRNLKKEIKVLNVTLEGIEEEIKKNQKELRRLVNDDKVTRDDISSEYIQLDCVEKIEEIDNSLKLWHDVGLNEEDYLRFNREGYLDEILVEGKCLTSSDVKTLKRIISSRVRKR